MNIIQSRRNALFLITLASALPLVGVISPDAEEAPLAHQGL